MVMRAYRLAAMTPLSGNALAGVAGGTLLSFVASIQYADLAEAVVLSALGAVVSFVVSALLAWVVKKVSKR
jgi:mannitol-specific phosphotransferase system IIBC component